MILFCLITTAAAATAKQKDPKQRMMRKIKEMSEMTTPFSSIQFEATTPRNAPGDFIFP